MKIYYFLYFRNRILFIVIVHPLLPLCPHHGDSHSSPRSQRLFMHRDPLCSSSYILFYVFWRFLHLSFHSICTFRTCSLICHPFSYLSSILLYVLLSLSAAPLYPLPVPRPHSFSLFHSSSSSSHCRFYSDGITELSPKPHVFSLIHSLNCIKGK